MEPEADQWPGPVDGLVRAAAQGVAVLPRIGAFLIDLGVGGVMAVSGYALWLALGRPGTASPGEAALGLSIGLGVVMLAIVVAAVWSLVKGATPGQSATGLIHVDDSTGRPAPGRHGRKLLLLLLTGLPTLAVAPLIVTARTVRAPAQQSWYDARAGVQLIRRATLKAASEQIPSPIGHRVDLPITPVAFGVAPPSADRPGAIEVPPQPEPPGVTSSPASPEAAPYVPSVITPGPIDTRPLGTAVADRNTLGGREGSTPDTTTGVPSLALVSREHDEVQVDGTVLLGRDPAIRPGFSEARLMSVDDATRKLSKTHAAVGTDGSMLWVMDLNSTNGVWVAEAGRAQARVPAGVRTSVPIGAELTMGGVTYTVVER